MQNNKKPSMVDSLMEKLPPKWRKPKLLIALTVVGLLMIYFAYQYITTPAGEAVPTPISPVVNTVGAINDAGSRMMTLPSGPPPTPTPDIPKQYDFTQFTREWEACYEQLRLKNKALMNRYPTMTKIIEYVNSGATIPVESALLTDVQKASKDLMIAYGKEHCVDGKNKNIHKISGRLGWLVERGGYAVLPKLKEKDGEKQEGQP